MATLSQVRLNWRLKALLPVAGVLLAGLLIFVWLTFPFEVSEPRKVILVGGGGVVAVCAVILVVLAVLIQRPLLELRQKISQVREGNLTVTASFAGQHDEIGDLGRDFNEMVKQLRESLAERKRAEEEIRALNADLEQRVVARTAELEAASKIKDELIIRERAATAKLAKVRAREIEIGFRIQQMLLLDQPPQDIAGLRVAAITVPSQRVDGDFYMFFRNQNESLDVVVGDVMGKGIPAALLGAATKVRFPKAIIDLMVAAKGKLPEPSEIVMLAHAGVVRHLIELESFVTLCYARLDANRGSLEFVDCGHTGVVHLHRKTGLCELLHGDNLPMGVSEGEIYNQISVPFEAGDLVLLYSDGITESRNPERELFGVERLKETVLSNRDLEPAALVAAIREAVFAFAKTDRLIDDLTTVAIRVEEMQLPIAHANTRIHSDLKQLRRAREFVRAFCQTLPGPPLDEESECALELAVNEAASNIMKHAYHGRTDQWIDLDIEMLAGRIAVRLHHLGDSFDPSMTPSPILNGSRESGFGAYIMSQTVDEVRYYRDERGRNCVTLTKICRSYLKKEA